MKNRSTFALAAAGAVAATLAAPNALAAESCIVSDPGGRLALIDSPLPDKAGTATTATALPLAYGWAIDWFETPAAEWPLLKPGFLLFL